MSLHIIQAMVENKFGVLARIASLFSARGYNITSLSVGETNDPTMSCVTIVVNAEDERILDQIQKQLNKLIDVITVKDLTRKEHLDRELLLIRVPYTAKEKKTLAALEKKFSFEAVRVKGEDSLVISFAGSGDAVRELLAGLQSVGITQLVRTGKVAINT